jgi:hypothetical protein
MSLSWVATATPRVGTAQDAKRLVARIVAMLTRLCRPSTSPWDLLVNGHGLELLTRSHRARSFREAMERGDVLMVVMDL